MVSIVSAARDLGRIREVGVVLVRHGFGEIAARIGLFGRKDAKSKDEGPDPSEGGPGASGPVARRIRAVLEDLGPSFVKLGQLASTRPDLLPKDLILELKKLQDSVGPVPFEDVREQMATSLPARLEDLFEWIDETPLAAGSIAQVHRARLKTEEGPVDVAIKVQRPGIVAKISSDLDILHTLAALLERAIPETRIYSPVGLVHQFDQAITAELDFVQEAENARRFQQNFAQNPEVVFPYVYREASSKHTITLAFLEGDKVYDAIKKGHSGKAIAQLAFRTMIQQIYEDGFFHADPHPGNILIQGSPEAPRLAMVDLGMVGRMSPRMRDLTIDVVTSALRKDTDGIAMALYEIGTPTKKIDMEAYKAEVALLSEKLLGRNLGEVDIGELIRDLVRAATKYGISIPTDFLLMGKALVTIEGVGKEIYPAFDLMEEARPLFAELLRKRYSPERLGTDLWRRLERLGGVGYRVPQQLEEVLDDVRMGRLAVTVNIPERERAMGRASRHLTSGIVVAALALGAAVLFSVRRDEFAWAFAALAAVATSYQFFLGVLAKFSKD
jgi:ubiquinone biosynthesis protein